MDIPSSRHVETHEGNRLRVWMTCAMAALAGLLFGLEIGVIAGALPFIAKDFQVSDRLHRYDGGRLAVLPHRTQVFAAARRRDLHCRRAGVRVCT
jgi:hypothetical protein